MEPTSPTDRKAILDDIMEEWEDTVKGIGIGRQPLLAMLELSALDIIYAARTIDCPFCRRHMLLEAHEIKKVMGRIESESNMSHRHGLRDRMSTMLDSTQIVANVLLGGLRRAGLI